MSRLIDDDEYLTKKGRLHHGTGGKWRISVKKNANIIKKNLPSIHLGEIDSKGATYPNTQNNRKIEELKKELDNVRSQFKKFRNIASIEIKTLKNDRHCNSAQYLNYKEKISNIEKYAETLRHDNYIVYFSLMNLIDSKEIKSK